MNKSIILLVVLMVGVGRCHQSLAQQATAAYDSSLAHQWGADEYGMRQYILVFLKSGPNRPTDKAEAAKLQAAHMKYIGELAREGQLLLAGPFTSSGELRGVFLFKTNDINEARALTQADPAVKYGSLVMELHPWYGSAALMGIPKMHEKGQKTSF